MAPGSDSQTIAQAELKLIRGVIKILTYGVTVPLSSAASFCAKAAYESLARQQ